MREIETQRNRVTSFDTCKEIENMDKLKFQYRNEQGIKF